jgi:predicted ATP-grasp superfamily ATP-dependent carboligase
MASRRVFVTSGVARSSLAAVRSLGRLGLHVTVGESVPMPLASFSRYCHRSVRYPSLEGTPEEFLDWLQRHLAAERYDVVMPVDQYAFFLLSRHREILSRFAHIPVADFPVFLDAYDKARTFRAAGAANVPCPRTYFPSSREDVEAITREAAFPLVVKPRVGSGSRAVAYVRDREELLRRWEQVHQEVPCPLIQEYIPPGGEALGVSVLLNRRAEPRAVFAHKRLREYPVTGGPSTLRESVVRPVAAELAVRLLRELGWYGVAMVEFKVDPRDGVPKLMEVNPKLWGSLALAIAAGVDFPALLYQLALDGDVQAVTGYRVGVRCRFLLADTLHFLSNPDRLRLRPSYFQFGQRDTHGDVWDSRDPMPVLGLWLELLARGWRPRVLSHVLRRSRRTPGLTGVFALEGVSRDTRSSTAHRWEGAAE